jgi:hypothetical protein
MKHFQIINNNSLFNIVPAKKFIPEWYRKSETLYESDEGKMESGLKTCVPFLDSMMAGYMLITTYDFHVKTTKDTVDYRIMDGEMEVAAQIMVGERKGQSGSLIPRPTGHAENHMIWRGDIGWKTPRKWSVLVTHPSNRFDLPFTTMSGIIDSDKWWAPGNIPFFFKADMEAFVPRGTPVAQLIPVKRSKWSLSNNSKYIKDDMNEIGDEARKVERGFYKKNLWERKEYE